MEDEPGDVVEMIRSNNLKFIDVTLQKRSTSLCFFS